MNVLTKALELAEALETSPELNQMREAEKVMHGDKVAMSLMNDFNAKQMEAYNLQVSGEDPSDKLMEELNALRQKLEENDLIMDYLTAQEEVGKILEYINNAISQVLQGDSGCSSSDCAGCSGC